MICSISRLQQACTVVVACDCHVYGLAVHVLRVRMVHHVCAASHAQVGAVPQAYIYAPARTASQQGQSKTATLKAKGPAWKIEFEVQEKCVIAAHRARRSCKTEAVAILTIFTNVMCFHMSGQSRAWPCCLNHAEPACWLSHARAGLLTLPIRTPPMR